MAALVGLHVVCGYVGIAGFSDTVLDALNGIAWSETLDEAGETTLTAIADDAANGRPAFELTSAADGWVAVGAAPDAAADPRCFLKAGRVLRVAARVGDKVDWLPATAAPSGAAASVAITVGEEDADVVNVAIQLKDRLGNDLTQEGSVVFYLSDDADGSSLAASAPDSVAIGTEGLMLPLNTDDTFGRLVSNDEGVVDLDIGETGTASFYLVVVLPDGSLAVSDEIALAGA